MSLFRSGDEASKALRRIAELLFRRTQLFGQLGVDQQLSPGQINRAVMDAGLVQSLLQILESTVDLQFDSAPVPFCYNTATWPPELSAGGYTGGASGPLPSHVCSSLALAWNVDKGEVRTLNASTTDTAMSSTGYGAGIAYRLIRSALAVALREGLGPGLRYLIDMLHSGYLTDTRPLVDAMYILLVARSQTDSETDMIRHFFGGRLPVNAHETVTEPIDCGWLRIASLGPLWHRSTSLIGAVDLVISREKVEPYLMGLLVLCQERVALVRDAIDFDGWVPGQITLGAQIRVTRAVVTGLIPSPPLAVRAMLSQLEEIGADADALASMLRNEYGVPSFYSDMHLAFIDRVAQQYRKALGDDWSDRFCAERLLVPSSLRSSLLPRPLTGRRVEAWDSLSWLIAHPFCIALRGQEPVVVLSKRSETSVEMYGATEAVVPAMVSRRPSVSTRLMADSAASSEWTRQLGLGPDLVARAMLALLGASDARRAGATTVVDGLTPTDVAKQHGAVLRLHESLAVKLAQYAGECMDEVMRSLDESRDAREAPGGEGERSTKLDILHRTQRTYPWSWAVYWELGIAADEAGDPRAGLDFLVRALVLNPRQSLIWQSLSVVLERLDLDREARVASAISTAVREVEGRFTFL